MNFKEYWYKFCPTVNRVQARKLWNMYEDVSDVSTDFIRDDLTVTDIKKAKKALQAANVPMHTFCVQTDYHTRDFYKDCIKLAPLQAAAPCYPAECKKQKGNNPMYIDNDKYIESSKINYLTDRATSAHYAAQDKIADTFNLRTPKAPDTPEALVAAITSGNYTIPPKGERCQCDRAANQIVWRAPTVKADPDGAEAAKKAFDVLYKSAKDAIMIQTPVEALTAVQALDAWTPTVTVAS